MTRRDFVAIAASIRESREACLTDAERSAVADVALRLLPALRASNPRFDRGRFLAACGIGA